MARRRSPLLFRLARVWSWPLWISAQRSSAQGDILSDVDWWIDCLEDEELISLNTANRFAYLSGALPEFRTLVHYRLRQCARLPIRAAMRALYRAPKTILFEPGNLGHACFIQHGLATVVVAESVGHHFKVGQQVTIGHTAHGKPTIGDHVTVGAGALVLGDITIGDGAVIGAGAIVVDDVAAGAVMVSPKAVPRHPPPAPGAEPFGGPREEREAPA